jgi:hypothetical protein
MLMLGVFLWHGRNWLGWPLLGLFAVVWLLVVWSAERLGLATGFPFGAFAYTDQLRPFIFGVPLIVLLGYLTVGYCSFFLAHVLASAPPLAFGRRRRLARALLTAVLMVFWDICADPVRATAEDRWIWPEGGAHLGVPLSNYAGWFVTTLVAVLLFEAALSAIGPARRPRRDSAVPIPRTRHAPPAVAPILMFAAVAVEYVTYLIAGPAPTLEEHAALYRQQGLTALSLMVLPAVIALARYAALRRQAGTF